MLAHLWLNFLLDEQNAYSNFVNFNGYQPPLNEIDPAGQKFDPHRHQLS